MGAGSDSYVVVQKGLGITINISLFHAYVRKGIVAGSSGQKSTQKNHST